MKSKCKIVTNGGYYYDDVINNTVKFVVSRNQSQFVGYPTDGVNISIDTSDSIGERESGLDGNTCYKWNGMKWVKRETELSITSLIREILNLPK